jgi:hypothetical protein
MIAETDVHPPGDQTAAPESGQNVERIRDILFGSQMREYAQRFLQMEERLAQETAQLRAEFDRRMVSTETHSRQQSDSLADRLNAERTERAESVDRVTRELSDSVRLLDRRLRQTDEQTAKELRELSQSMLDRHRSLSDEVTQAMGALGASQNRRVEELRASAVDRFALADLLAEVALRLRGEFRIPEEGDSPNAGADK